MHRENKKIGILGGTFNPVHQGHVALGQAAYKQFGLDEVWFMVAKIPPHKRNLKIPSASVRSEMVTLALKGIHGMAVSDFELRQEGYSYTAKTLELLKQEYPQHEFYFIIGGDSLRDLKSWYHPEIILGDAVLLASQRQDMDDGRLVETIRQLTEEFPGSDIRRIEFGKIPYSSTEIREMICQGQDVSDMTGKKVFHYIKAHHLYEDADEEKGNGRE